MNIYKSFQEFESTNRHEGLRVRSEGHEFFATCNTRIRQIHAIEGCSRFDDVWVTDGKILTKKRKQQWQRHESSFCYFMESSLVFQKN